MIIRVPPRRSSRLEQTLFLKLGRQKLNPHRHPGRLIGSGGNADPALPGEVQGDGEDIRQVHLQGIALFSELERGRRRHRRQQKIALLVSLGKVAADERAHLLRPEIIGVVVAA